MPSTLKYIAQSGMDQFYASFKNDYQFFTLEDFIDNTGNTIAGMYQDIFDAQRKELKGEKKDEIVMFDTGMLAEQILDVKRENGQLYADIIQPVMTFLTDSQNSGIQVVFDQLNNTTLERTTVNSLFEFQYYPKTNRVFFYAGIDKINFINKGDCNLKKVRVLYVPKMYADAIVADTIADDAVQQTILQMRQLIDKGIVKKTLDNNENFILETEVNKKALAG